MSGVNETVLFCGDASINLPYVVHSNVILAIGIIIALSFLQKRKTKWLDTCDGRPGALIPVNMLDNFENRWSFACSFGAITNVLVSVLMGEKADVDLLFLRYIRALLYAVEISIVFFPFFACLTIPQKKVGSLVGLCYAGLWALVMLVATILCPSPFPDLMNNSAILINLPSLICLGFLTGKFSIMTYQAFNRPEVPVIEIEKTVAVPYQISYVRTLLSKQSSADDSDQTTGINLARLKRFINNYIYENRPHFKFTTRIICTIVIVVTGTTQLATTTLLINTWVFKSVSGLLNNVTIADDTLKKAQDYMKVIEAIWILVAIFCILFMCFDLFAILAKYRMNLLQLYKGDYSFMPHNYKDSSGVILKNSMIFPGYQIAYKIIGFFILKFVVTLILLVLAILFIVVPFILGYIDILWWILQATVIPAILSLLFKYMQIFVSNKYLLQDKVHPGDNDKPLAIENRRLYHIVNYFLFIANIGLGLFSSLFRLLLSFIWGVVFLGRIDRSALVPGFETRDKGYMAYLGMLLVEHSHNNPTMRVFCQNLLEATSLKRNNVGFMNQNFGIQADQIQHTDIDAKLTKRKLVQKRWSLLVTLLHNPQLIPLRSHHLCKKQAKKEFGKVAKIFKMGVLGIIPSSSSANLIQSASSGNYELSVLVARQLHERYQRQNHHVNRTASGQDTELDTEGNGNQLKMSFDNDLYGYLPEQKC